MSKRLIRWYFKDEKEVMKMLGLKPQPGSGSGVIHKEDGINENIIAQLKTTDKKVISIKVEDFKSLERNALVTHTVPLFVNQILNDKKEADLYVTCKVEDLQIITNSLNKDLYKKEIIPDEFRDWI